MRKQYSLDRDWSFFEVNANKEIVRGEKETVVNLPHSWNVDDNTERNMHLYVKDLKIDEKHRDDRLYLEFMGANAVCQVYCGEQFVGEHRGGYSTFRFDVTKYYSWEGENQLLVYVDNRQTEDVSPLNGDFTIYGGLYRSVNLICVQESHFDLLFYGSSGVILRSDVNEDGVGILDIESHIVSDVDVTVNYSLKDGEGIVVLEGSVEVTDTVSAGTTQNGDHQENFVENKVTEYRMTVNDCKAWKGKDDPCLYELQADLIRDGKVVDAVNLKTGFRKCHLDSEQGFFLNGYHVKINGVAKHQDFEGVGNAITSEHIIKDFELIEDIGANSVRLSHYQHCQETYDICDSEGYIVWAEIPMMSMPDKACVLHNASEQLKELVYQNSHHPSICFWGIQNEIAMDGETLAMYRGVNELNDLFHSLLPNAISASANMYFVKNDSTLNFITDLLGYNQYYGWYYGQVEDLDEWFDQFHAENPQVVLGMSEYGADCNLKFHSAEPKVKDYSEEFQSIYHEKTYNIIELKPYLWGSYVWNMFDFGSFVRDEGGTKGKNAKGLVTFDRKIKKDAYYFYKSKWSDKLFVHLCEKRFVNRPEDSITIKAYSNLDSLELFVNDESVGTIEGESVFVFEDIRLEMGENSIRIIGAMDTGIYTDECVFIRTEEKDQSYVYVDPNPGLNVENWFSQEKSELDFFPEGYYSIKDKIGDLMESEEAWSILIDKAPQIVERATPGATVTLLWVFNKMRALFTESEIMAINSELIKIEKNIN